MNIIGRDHELRLLRQDLERCLTDRRGGGTLLAGPVGVGRTALLLRLGEEAAALGANVRHATCSPLEHDFPLSAIHQLLHTTELDPADSERCDELLAEGALVAGTCSGRLTAPVVQGLCDLLGPRASGGPTVLLVDDAQHIDAQSLEVLLYTARRIRTLPVLIVLAERDATTPASATHSRMLADLARQDHFRRIVLAPLSAPAIARLLRGALGARSAERLAVDWHAVSGGNALLIKALIDDRERRAAQWSGCAESGFSLGESFRRGLITCLYRLEPQVLAVAQALSMLGEPAPAALLGDLAGVDADVASRSVSAMDAAGLLDRGWFRHPDARAEVMRSLDAAALAALHRRAAFLLHGSDAEATRVARHLAAAGDVREPWASPILQAAARHALDAGRAETAVQWLRLAERAGADERQRAAAKAALIQVEARLDPANLSRHLPWVVDTLRREQLSGSLALTAVKYAYWHGRPQEAADALARLRAAGTEVPGRLRAWLEVWYPGALDHRPSAGARPALAGHRADDDGDRGGGGDSYYGEDGDGADGGDPGRADDGLVVLADLLSGHDARRAVERAERVLRGHRGHAAGSEEAVESLVAALTVLLYADQADRAARWCEPLQDHTTSGCSPMWRAMLTAERAQAALRLGELEAAAEAAQEALTQITLEGWGIAAGIPLSVLALARTRLGRSEHAARHLAAPVPQAMAQTPAGALLGYAQGVHDLAEGRPEAALAHFHGCGQYLIRHRIDLPGIAAWRLGAAQAYLSLGRVLEARSLIHDQLAACAEGSRTHGMALRLSAATLTAARHTERVDLLTRACTILDRCGDQAELMSALEALAAAHHEFGESALARVAERRAAYLRAAICLPAAEPATAIAATSEPAEAEGQGPAGLTDSEARVAVLAAQGLTNRQISGRLYVTVSTVEQHLTRIYRKLGVTRRADLPTRLGAAALPS